MRTLRDTAGLLAAADSVTGLVRLAEALGFHDAAEPLDADAQARLGLAAGLTAVHVVRGRGALRALVVVAPPGQPLRDRLGSIATALARHTAHVLWIVLATSEDEVGIACWNADRHPPRLAALRVDRRRVFASDADAFGMLAAAAGEDDVLAHARWHETLGRDALTRRFYRTLAQRVAHLARSLVAVPAAEAGELALLTTSRLLFLAFLEAKGWLNGERDFLTARFDECMRSGGGFHGRVLLPLFFGTLNTPTRRRASRARAFGAIPFLNGGLFARTALERRRPRARCSDEALGELFAQLLAAYRFTAREDDAHWSEVAIDPEMLGRAFESLMADRDRRTSGAFYTPQPLVAHLADDALATALAGDGVSDAQVRAALGGTILPERAASALAARLAGFTVLDPACGSGAFLVHLLERLTALHRAAGDARSLAEIRRSVLSRCVHGVDVNPTAVWLCELRLWLCVVIESDETRIGAVPPLPNLDCNVRVGDALAGAAFVESPTLVGPSRLLVRMREQYARATGPRKAPLRRALARDERRRAVATIDRALAGLAAVRRERLLAQRAADLFGDRHLASTAQLDESRQLRARAAALRRERRRLQDGGALPFGFPSHFAHVHARGGFTLVVGNPPWVRLHNIPSATRAELRARFTVFGDAGWQPDFPGLPAAHGFGLQADLAALFVERSLALVAPDGVVGLLLPAKLWRSLSGGPVRRLLLERATVRRVEDWSDAPCSFDAAVYPSVLVAARATGSSATIHTGVRRRRVELAWRTTPAALRLTTSTASPWLIVPPDVRESFDALVAGGLALGASDVGRATLGVKCGCNDAFTVHMHSADGDQVAVEHHGREGRVERALLRPLLRGEGVTPWAIADTGRAILWTHGPAGAPLDTLPPGAARWLAPWKRRLVARTDLRGSRTWWMLFRTDAADASRPRVVWSDFGQRPRAAFLPAGERTVPLNSCYVVACDDERDALALTALFNSAPAAAWLNVIAEPARGGWHRYLAWTVSLLPLPSDWPRARAILAPFTERALLGSPPGHEELRDAACEAYRVPVGTLAALLEWDG